MNREELIEIMRRGFRKEEDDRWGPTAPNVHGPGIGAREMQIAYSVAGLAAGLEAAQEGLGTSLLRRFADDPEEICPPWPPWPFPIPHGPWPWPWPGPEPPWPIDRSLLGAALVITADSLRNKELAATATKLGNEMIG